MSKSPLDLLSKLTAPENPFPGLRPFEEDQSYLFFGRDGQSEELINRLAVTRFLAVIGSSGSGKSSLVRAGLLPALHGGLMAEAGSAWRVVVMKPGNDPLGNLAQELNERAAFGASNQENLALQIAITEATLRRGPAGLIDAVRDFNLPESENLLVVVDQFEELFRVRRQTQGEELENDKAAFVKLLLEAKERRAEAPKIYIVLTMRSDYLGDCAQFWDLPEAINQGQYLIPRLTREQRREAITGPIAVGGGSITPRLVNRLLNDVGEDPGQLPILQHALMRTWEEWKVKRLQVDGRPHQEVHEGEAIDQCCYDAIGGLARALSLHADEAYDDLTDRQKEIAAKMFKCLTEKEENNREGRRPATIAEIRDVAQAGEPEVIAVIEKFREGTRSFLTATPDEELNSETLIDISHESLIRGWTRLKKWADDEAESARIYRRLVEAAMLETKGSRWWLRDPELQLALHWREREKPNRDWALRYQGNFELVERFLNGSRDERENEIFEKEQQRVRELRRARFIAAILGAAFIIAVFALLYARKQQRVAEERRQAAEEQKKVNRRLNYTARINLAKDAFARGDLAWGRRVLSDFLIDPDGVRGFEWYHFWRRYPRELAMPKGRGQPVLSVIFSPDGKRLVSGYDDGTVKLWDAVSRGEVFSVKAHEAAVSSLAFSRDGKTLASGSGDGTMKLLDPGSGRELAKFQHGAEVRSIALSPAGERAASGGADGVVKLWDVIKGQELTPIKGHVKPVLSVAISLDGKMLVSGGEDGTAKLWDLNSGQEAAVLDLNKNPVLTVSFAPDGKKAAVGTNDGTVSLWETGGKHQDQRLKWLRTPVWSVTFSSDGRRLATGTEDGAVRLWEAGSGQELVMFKEHTKAVRSVAFSPDGKMLASGSWDGDVKMWETSAAIEAATLTGHKLPVKSVAYSPTDGQRLASAGEDGNVMLWDVLKDSPLATIPVTDGTVRTVAFSHDGQRLASGGADGTVMLWDATNGQPLQTIRGHGDFVNSVAFSPNGKMLASAGEDGKVMLWETASGRELKMLKGPGSSVRSVAFATDGGRLAAGVADGMVKLWDVSSGQEVTMKGHTDQVVCVAFSSDGEVLASGSRDGTVRLWDVVKGVELKTLSGRSAPILSVAFSPDGKRLATGSDDGMVKLWEAESGQEIVTLREQVKPIWSVAFAPDGRSLACGSEDGRIRLWFAAMRDEVKEIKPD